MPAKNHVKVNLYLVVFSKTAACDALFLQWLNDSEIWNFYKLLIFLSFSAC